MLNLITYLPFVFEDVPLHHLLGPKSRIRLKKLSSNNLRGSCVHQQEIVKVCNRIELKSFYGFLYRPQKSLL